ncbi:SDR family oxidoreductase [Nocardioides panaciterrulae]|uniref:NAD(P)-dependent dehydrogenase (Short-subunit alcohol dehydrogenase family) n=1 Tax=Nocardioides panaciterrulae TaxID=661492 RepID=A0A7Y9JDH1_9ACTN|nr:SDR family oxidoreductase [Nocardioides panaciterrulae]NYD43269.1 NAD(P)-dependent dehydrogenase (short-subunit alcohol dehydrogenase family) [Nocardioides panaciterrulae]
MARASGAAHPAAGARGESCVVTGGARGIGRGIAERMVARGYAVVLTDVDAAGAVRTAGEIGAVAGLGLDVRDPEAHRAAAVEAASYGVLTAWFNNAGVGDDGRLAELSEEAVRRLVEVNLLGTLWGMRAALAAFAESGRGGDVVNTASLAGLGPVPGYSVYAATKAAIVSASMSCDVESPRGVRVHALCPDGVQTAMLDGQTPGGLGNLLVLSGGRILGVDEVAEAAVALVGSRRVVRSLPPWRGGVIRASALAPSVTAKALGVFVARGRRALQRRAGSN